MTVEDLASDIAHHMEWSPHVGSYAERIAEHLLSKYDLVVLSAEPATEAPCGPDDIDPGETASWPA